MQISFIEVNIEDKNELVGFLTAEKWEFHNQPFVTPEKVLKQLNNGYFTGEGKKTFWITGDNNGKIGLIRLFDLGREPDSSETPLFDIKIKHEFRGKGIGEQAVKWLTDYVFSTYPQKNRFEATTRADNIAMRRVFEKCSFVKEAHYRKAWPDQYGNKFDCAGYAILRNDWENKTITPVVFDD